jgi:hypothetical protein
MIIPNLQVAGEAVSSWSWFSAAVDISGAGLTGLKRLTEKNHGMTAGPRRNIKKKTVPQSKNANSQSMAITRTLRGFFI